MAACGVAARNSLSSARGQPAQELKNLADGQGWLYVRQRRSFAAAGAARGGRSRGTQRSRLCLIVLTRALCASLVPRSDIGPVGPTSHVVTRASRGPCVCEWPSARAPGAALAGSMVRWSTSGEVVDIWCHHPPPTFVRSPRALSVGPAGLTVPDGACTAAKGPLRQAAENAERRERVPVTSGRQVLT